MKINSFFNLSGKVMLILLVASIAMTNVSCKSSKKASKKKAEIEMKEKKADAMARLQALLNPNNTVTIDDKFKELNAIKAMNLNDPEITSLIARVEAKLNKDREAIENEEENQQPTNPASPPVSQETLSEYAMLDRQFDEISMASTVDLANKRIKDALLKFESDNTVVLILIFTDGTVKDYDEPTTIRRYLEYLKDHKKNPNKVLNVKHNATGKISELELMKK